MFPGHQLRTRNELIVRESVGNKINIIPTPWEIMASSPLSLEKGKGLKIEPAMRQALAMKPPQNSKSLQNFRVGEEM